MPKDNKHKNILWGVACKTGDFLVFQWASCLTYSAREFICSYGAPWICAIQISVFLLFIITCSLAHPYKFSS